MIDPKAEALAAACEKVSPTSGMPGLQEALGELFDEAAIEWVLTRGGWHRLGGVVDSHLNRISSNISDWAEKQAEDDPDGLLASYIDSDYRVTRIAGKTHYFTLPVGEKAEDFTQIEIEELQEVIDRPLIMEDWYPETLADFIDPVNYTRLNPEPVGPACYKFRRITPIAELPRRMNPGRATENLRRFFADWGKSSAGDELFCRHWVLAIREYEDSDHETRVAARPLSTFDGELPELPRGEKLQGSELASAIHAYDRQLGYPFAWYFNLLRSKSENYELARAVLTDQMGAYDYLPVRDVGVLRAWEERPYSV